MTYLDGGRLLLPALLLTLTGMLAGCWEGGTSLSALSPDLYLCTGKDSLRIHSLQTGESSPSKVRVTLNGVSFGPLRQTETEVGLEYTGRGPTVLWAKGDTVLLERFGKTRAHGCRPLPDSTRREEPKKSGIRLNAWFRSPVGLNRHGYLLRYPRHLQVDQHHLRRTRFIYAGPKNEPPALTDGFSLHIGLERTSRDETLREHARDQVQNNRRAGGRRVSSFRDTTIRGRKGLFWREKTVLGTVASHLAVGLGPETLASISYTTVGARRKTYKQHVRRMLSTLRFPTRPAPPSHIDVPLAMLSDLEGSSPNGASREAGATSEPSQNGPSDGEDLERGCDEVVFVHRQIPLTANPLSAALDTLFSIDRDSVGGRRHFLARTNETLSLRHVFRKGSVLKVRLGGQLSGLRGICDHPRARIQIIETARRVAAVDSVALYLNGTPTDLQPGGRGL